MDVGSCRAAVVVVARTESNHPRKPPPSSPPTPSFYVRLWPGTKVDGAGGRTAPAYRGTPPPSPTSKYDGIIKCLGLHIQNQWLHTLDVQKGGWDLATPSTLPPPGPRTGKKGMITDDFAADILSNHTLICNCCPCFQFAFKIRFSEIIPEE